MSDINKVLNKWVEEIVEHDGLEKKLNSGKKLRIKLGVDPTGPRIHIGRGMQFWKLKQFQDLGHQIVIIIGDFTAQVGDASDKDAMRKTLTKEEILDNAKNYKEQIGKILDISKVEFRHNSEWFDNLPFSKLLELTMKFTAQQMIGRRNFKERWDQGKPIGVHEMLYPIMQGYDSLMIESDMELGGTDQLFNLKMGRELQRMYGQEPQDIMTLQMMDGLDGRKMSTSWGNIITIMDTPNEMFGKIMSMKDELIEHYYQLATDLEDYPKFDNPRDQKAHLGKVLVEMYNSKEEAEKAEEEFNKIFKDKGMPTDIPEIKIDKEKINILDLLVETKITESKGEARRLVEGGGLKVKEEQITDWQAEIEIEDGMIIQGGKRKFLKIVK